MGFVYLNKILSIEDIFSIYNKNGGETIDNDEVENAKNISIFKGFRVEEGMNLEQFERDNLEAYKRYEGINTAFQSPEYKNAPLKEKIRMFAEIHKKYYPEDAEDIDRIIQKAEESGYTRSFREYFGDYLEQSDLNLGFGLQ